MFKPVLSRILINNISVYWLISLFLFNFHCTAANDPRLDWKTLETSHFRIHFETSHKSIALKTATLAEKIHHKLSQRLNWQPKQKTDLILTDSTDFANGFASPFPNNRSTLIIQPTTSSMFDFTSWLEILITHEYTHILHLDKATGAPAVLRNVFGRFPLLFPNVFQPAWLIEGLATYLETDSVARIGRGQNSHFKMMMRLEVEQGIKPISKVNIRNTQWPINQVYLYGEHFYRFIAKKYGKEKIIQLSDEYGNDLVPFFINRNSNKVLGKDLSQLWQEFSVYLSDRYQPQIARIKAAGIREGKKITQDGFFTQAIETTENGLYYIRSNGLQQSMLIFRDLAGQTSEIVKINSTAQLDWHPVAGLLIAQPEICDEFNIFFDLYRIKPGSKKLTRLTHCARYEQARWSSSGDYIITLKSEAANYSFEKLTPSGDLIKTLWRGQNAQIISQFDLSNDNQHIVAAVREAKVARVQLKQFDIRLGQWSDLSGNKVNHIFPRYSHDGNSLYFSADYDGVYNFYKMELATKSTSQLSNVMGGVFQIGENYSQPGYYYLGYSANGFDLYQYQSPIETDLDSTQFNQLTYAQLATNNPSTQPLVEPLINDYSMWPSLSPAYWFPFANGNEDDIEIGVQTSGSDALGIHQYVAAVAANVDKEAMYGVFNYSYSRYVSFAYERSYDFSSEVNGMASYVLQNKYELGYHFPLSKIQSQWDFQLGIASNHITQGSVADGDFNPSSRFRDDVVGFAVSFNNSKRFFKSISQSDGRQISFTAESSNVISSDFSGETYLFDWREFFQLYHQHTLALRFVQGWGTESPNPFRLGGENGDGFILNGSHLTDRSYALRGYPSGLAQLRERRMQLASAEYRFPISRIEQTFMAPPVGLGTISGTLFYDRGAAYNGSPEEYYSGAGFELNTVLTLFYALPFNLRLGYAKGFDLGGEKRVYFSIGTSF